VLVPDQQRYNAFNPEEEEAVSFTPPGRARPPLPKEFFWREYACPLTGLAFDSVAVKSSAFTLRSRATDFRPIYDGINPQHYAAIVSPIGFAAEEDLMRNPVLLRFRDKDGLIGLLRSQPVQGEFNALRDLPTVCRAYELALSCSGFLRLPRSEIAGLALRTSWMFSEWAEQGQAIALDQAVALRNIALEHYLQAFEKEDVTRLKLGSGGVAYLIAELLREQVRYDEALRWYAIAVADKSTAAEVLRMARNQMELCRESRLEAKASGTYDKPKTERVKERSMYQLYADQAQWLAKASEGATLSESAMLRGIMDGLIAGGLNLKSFKAEQDLAAWLAAQIKEEQ
jgi:uncharacterized protein